MIVTTQVQRVHELRSILVSHTRVQVEWARDAYLAFDLSARVRPQLVLIDALLTGERVSLLRRDLTRGAQCATVVSIHQRGESGLRTPEPDAVHWDELPPLLRGLLPPVASPSPPSAAGMTT